MKKHISLGLLAAVCLGLSGCLTTTTQNNFNPRSLWSFSSYYSPAKMSKVAVVVKDTDQRSFRISRSNDITEAQINQMAQDEFTKVLLQKGYRVSSRADIERVMEELRFQRSGITSSQDAAKLGKMLNVDAILLLTVNSQIVDRRNSGYISYSNTPYDFGASSEISAQLISVQEAEVLGLGTFSRSVNTYGHQNIGSTTRYTAKVLASGIPQKFQSNSFGSSAFSTTPSGL